MTIESQLDTETDSLPRTARYWPLFLFGMLLFVLGPLLYWLQVRQNLLWMPWYVPILATAGVGLMLMSVIRRRGIIRIVGLLLFSIICGMQWYITLVAIRSPVYAGPALPNRDIPAFSTQLASGEPFTDQDMRSGVGSVVVFFRGRW